MGRKTVLLDDLDGTELPDDASPIHLSLGRTTYALYLTEDNHGKLLKALEPFIENAETVGTSRSSSTPRAAASGDKEKMKKVREWASASNFEFTNAAGEKKKLGDRGRIPQEVIDAYDKAN